MSMLGNLFSLLRRQPLRRGPRRLLGGVCHGLARHLHCEPGLVRLVALLCLLVPVLGWLVYLVAWLLLPWQDGTIVLERILTEDTPRNPSR